jgi:hypothetical protein
MPASDPNPVEGQESTESQLVSREWREAAEEMMQGELEEAADVARTETVEVTRRLRQGHAVDGEDLDDVIEAAQDLIAVAERMKEVHPTARR